MIVQAMLVKRVLMTIRLYLTFGKPLLSSVVVYLIFFERYQFVAVVKTFYSSYFSRSIGQQFKSYIRFNFDRNVQSQ